MVMAKADQGIHKTEHGEEQPKDKSRAQEAHTTKPEKSVSHEGTRRTDHRDTPRKDGRGK
jgi:hypothetical protein